jgi:hypothetical protein
MRASLMRRYGARLEVARDNTGHSGGTSSIILDAYSMTWWNERIETVSKMVEAAFTEPDYEDDEMKRSAAPLKGRPGGGVGEEWNPLGNLRLFCLARNQCKLSILMVGESGFEPSTPWSRTSKLQALSAVLMQLFRHLGVDPGGRNRVSGTLLHQPSGLLLCNHPWQPKQIVRCATENEQPVSFLQPAQLHLSPRAGPNTHHSVVRAISIVLALIGAFQVKCPVNQHISTSYNRFPLSCIRAQQAKAF